MRSKNIIYLLEYINLLFVYDLTVVTTSQGGNKSSTGLNSCVNIEADHLEVRAGAKINGDVVYSVIEVHQGSNINGRMVLKNSEKSLMGDSEPLPRKRVLTGKPGHKSSSTLKNNDSLNVNEIKKNITEQPLS